MSTSTKIRATAASLVSLLVALSLLGLSHRVAPPGGGAGHGAVAPAAAVSSPQAPTSPSVAASDQSWSAQSGGEEDGYESE